MWAKPSPPWAANPPPGETRHENDPPNIAASLICYGAVSTSIAVIAVCLRLYTRIFSTRGLKADDYLIVLATGFLVGFFAICVRITTYGVGTHIWEVHWANYTPGILQLIFFAQVIGCLMISLNKLSVLSLYTFITPKRRFQAAVYFLMGIVVFFTLVYILIQVMDCEPVQAQWDLSLAATEHDGPHCAESNVSPIFVLSVVNIVVDMAVILLPIPVILPLQIPRKDKIQCLLLFAAGGGLVFIAAIGRTVQLIPLLGSQPDKVVDITWLVVPELNWASAEGSVGIVAASLPSIRPLFKRLLPNKVCDRGGSNNDRSGVALEHISRESRGSKANKHHQWPRSKDGTLHCGQQDEELGLCPGPGRST